MAFKKMNINTQLFYKAAKTLGLPIHYISELNYLDLHLGAKHYYVVNGITPFNEAASVYIFRNKFNMNQL